MRYASGSVDQLDKALNECAILSDALEREKSEHAATREQHRVQFDMADQASRRAAMLEAELRAMQARIDEVLKRSLVIGATPVQLKHGVRAA